MGYKLFIDESGDQGIDRDNEGQSKLFFFGGFVVSSTYLPYLSSFIEFCEKEIEQKIHFKRLTHEKKVFFCNKLSKLPICCFGLISDKKGLDRGNYREKITRQKGFFYNKNAHYFLEAVGDLCEQKPLELDEIIFEKIENKNYAQMKGYLHTIKNNPLHPNAKRLTKIPINRIDAKAKSEEPLLKIADAISHSLYRACIKDSFGHTEHRYLDLMKNKFYADENGQIANFGIQAVPKGFKNLSTNQKNIEFLLNLKTLQKNPTSTIIKYNK